MFDNNLETLTRLEEFFYKLTNLSDDFRDIQIKKLKKMNREQNNSFFHRITNVLDKSIYLFINFLLILYLYYSFLFVSFKII